MRRNLAKIGRHNLIMVYPVIYGILLGLDYDCMTDTPPHTPERNGKPVARVEQTRNAGIVLAKTLNIRPNQNTKSTQKSS